MQPRLRFFLVLSALVFALAIGALADESNVRIVRLSYVNGQVQLDRDGNSGLDDAFLNMPLANGAELVTQEDGYAEVEFEAGTTVRLVPNSDLHFRRLGLDDGNKLSVLEVMGGTAYFNVRHEGHDEFHVLINGQDLLVPKSSRFRVVMRQDDAQVSVLSGELQLFSGDELKIKKNQTLSFDFRGTGNPFVSDTIETLAYDAWNQEREGYTGRYVASGSYLGYSSGFSYGWSDLNYFGSFIDVAGYGSCWRPYGFDQYWDPYMDGAWVWYPGWGYTWVSGYPWGWAPYRYGRWIFIGGYGWVWQPGHRWNSWYAYSPVYNPPSGYHHHRPPDHPPVYHPPIVAGGGGGHPHPGQPGSGEPRPRGRRPLDGDRDDIVVVGRGPFSGNGNGLPGRGGQTGGSANASGNVTAGGAVTGGATNGGRTNGAQSGGRPLPVAITPGVLPNREAVIEQLRRVHGEDLGVRGNVGARSEINAGTGVTAPAGTGATVSGSTGVQTGTGGATGNSGVTSGSGGTQTPPQVVITPSRPQYGSGNVGQEQKQHDHVTPTPRPLYQPPTPTTTPQQNTTTTTSGTTSTGSISTGSGSTGSGSTGSGYHGGGSAGSGGSSGWHPSGSSGGSSTGSSSSGSTSHGGGSTGSTGSTGSSGGSHSTGNSGGSHSSSSSSGSHTSSSSTHDPK